MAATRYPPDGVRGLMATSRATRFGAAKDYFRTANASIGVVVAVETVEAVDQLEEIASVPGVDALLCRGPPTLRDRWVSMAS